MCFGRIVFFFLFLVLNFGKPVKGNIQVARTALVLEAWSMRCGWSTDRPTDRPTSKHVSMPSNIRYVNLCKKWMRISPKYEILKIHASQMSCLRWIHFRPCFGYAARTRTPYAKTIAVNGFRACIAFGSRVIASIRIESTQRKQKTNRRKTKARKRRNFGCLLSSLFICFFLLSGSGTWHRPKTDWIIFFSNPK